jgi:quercetin dioxygenase-like cupin family protein
MKRVTRLLFFLLLSAVSSLMAQSKVESSGITSTVKVDEVIFGHLAELNGKFKVRATEATFAPGAYLGVHHHVGPGIRYVVSGTLTFTEGSKVTVYRAGDYFFESGNVAHTAQNKTKSPLRIVFFEVVPAHWTGPTVIVPKAY